MKFKKGDRVKVYGTVHGGTLPERLFAYYLLGSTGVVTNIRDNKVEMKVLFDCKGETVSNHAAVVHPKQCRKIKKKANK